jgi:flagellar basal-body rod protein FlgC
MDFFSNFEISASGLSAQRLRMDVVANNIANVNTTRGTHGGPYQRERVVFEPRDDANRFLLPFSVAGSENRPGRGVRVVGLAPDPTPPKMVYDPGHPDANAAGYVAMPNVNIVNEMVDLLSASRAYEANVTAINAAKSMAMKALEIGKA